MYWRSIPISDNAVMRLQPALPPMEAESGQQYPTGTAEHVAGSVWAMEGYFMVCCLAVCLQNYLLSQAKALLCFFVYYHDNSTRASGKHSNPEDLLSDDF